MLKTIFLLLSYFCRRWPVIWARQCVIVSVLVIWRQTLSLMRAEVLIQWELCFVTVL